MRVARAATALALTMFVASIVVQVGKLQPRQLSHGGARR